MTIDLRRSQTIMRHEIGRSVRIWSVNGIAYAIVSAICFVAVDVNWLVPIIQSTLYYLWVLGPPANLLHQTNFLWPYFAGTAGFLLLLVGGLCVRQPAIGVVFLLLSALVWGLFGILVYAPAI